jgi:hypothetical protein
MHNAESDCSSLPRNASHTESDCSLPTPTDQPYAENDSKTSHKENPDEIAFFQLVGDEYDFPLNI